MRYAKLSVGDCREEEISVVDVHDLNPADFHDLYWQANKPVLIKGAINHWPARSNWSNPEYLRGEVSEFRVEARREPQNEAMKMPGNNGLFEMDFGEFCSEVGSGLSEPIWLHSVPLLLPSSRKSDQNLGGNFPKLFKHLSNLGNRDFKYFKFLDNVGPSRVYPSWRVFLYRNSFTDWHAHITDSHLMCQISGDKEVFILPPNEGYSVIQPMYDDKKRSFEMDENFLDDIIAAKPFRLVVEEGDALHIPVHWYHMVRPTQDTQFGVTVAYAFASPLRVNGDKRFLINADVYNQARWQLKPLLLSAKLISYFQKNRPLTAV